MDKNLPSIRPVRISQLKIGKCYLRSKTHRYVVLALEIKFEVNDGLNIAVVGMLSHRGYLLTAELIQHHEVKEFELDQNQRYSTAIKLS